MFLLLPIFYLCDHHFISGIVPSHAGFLALCHVVSPHSHRHSQSNLRLVSDSGNQKELIVQVSKSHALNSSLDNLFQVTNFKSVFLGFSNKNISLEFSQKKLLSYHVWHCTSLPLQTSTYQSSSSQKTTQ